MREPYAYTGGSCKHFPRAVRRTVAIACGGPSRVVHIAVPTRPRRRPRTVAAPLPAALWPIATVAVDRSSAAGRCATGRSSSEPIVGASQVAGSVRRCRPPASVAGASAAGRGRSPPTPAPSPAPRRPPARPTPAAAAIRRPSTSPPPRPGAPPRLDPDRLPLAARRAAGSRCRSGRRPWGSRIVDGELFHDGIDLATFCGDRVVAAHDGVVLAAGRQFDDVDRLGRRPRPYYRPARREEALGRRCRSSSSSTTATAIAASTPTSARSPSKPGDASRPASCIGYEGRTGHASGCHVHYGLFSPLETDDVRRSSRTSSSG